MPPVPAEPPRDCPLCPRLVEYRRENQRQNPDWFNGPAPSFGDPDARLLVAGLAPGRTGDNRTGRPFTGDGAGVILYETLLKTGDILLSAGPGILSAAIRAFPLAPASHAAIYIGNEEVVEAVGSGVRRQTADEVLDDITVVAAFRHPRIEAGHAEAIREFWLDEVGQP